MLDNMTDGMYVLDNKGNYLYVNKPYVEMLNMPKSVLLKYNVHDFLDTGQINVCVSDIVYKEKRQIITFQDVYDPQRYGREKIRQLIISTPILTNKVKSKILWQLPDPSTKPTPFTVSRI